MKKRALSWLLALTMLLTLAPQTLPGLGVGHRGKEQHSHPNRKQALGQHVQRVGPEPERVK